MQIIFFSIFCDIPFSKISEDKEKWNTSLPNTSFSVVDDAVRSCNVVPGYV